MSTGGDFEGALSRTGGIRMAQEVRELVGWEIPGASAGLKITAFLLTL